MTVENSGSIRADSAVGGDARALLARRDPNRGTLSVSQVMGKQSIAKKGQGRTIIADVNIELGVPIQQTQRILDKIHGLLGDQN
jgi:hypothetical protein